MTPVLIGFHTNLFLASHPTTSQIHPDSTPSPELAEDERERG